MENFEKTSDSKREVREQLLEQVLKVLNKDGDWNERDLSHLDKEGLINLLRILNQDILEVGDKSVATADPEDEE